MVTTQAGVAAQATVSSPTFTVVAQHLANPRGLSFAGDGGEDLYISQAGLGGGNVRTGVQVGTSQTGSVEVVKDADDPHPQVRTISAHLWSQTTSGPHGFETAGPAGISVRSDDVIYVVMQENFVTGLGPQPQQGRLLQLTGGGRIRSVADVASASLKWESVPANKALNDQFPDTNPYGVAAAGREVFVVDAAANTVDAIGPGGAVRVLAYLPNTPKSDAVPTCITKGPDGALYVGTLALADGAKAAKVYRVDPRTTAPITKAATVWASGLTAINGCAFSPDGKYFYASEFLALETLKGPPVGPPPSAVVKIAFSNPATHSYIGLGVLHFAGGVAVDRDGAVYVSNWCNQGRGTPIGQVLRFHQ